VHPTVQFYISYTTNESELLNCTLNSDVGEHVGSGSRSTIGFNGQCTPISDLPPDIIVVENAGRNFSNGTLTVTFSVRIIDPDRESVYLWCCWDPGNGTIPGSEHYYMYLTSDDDLAGK
jgi:hypothetical protein